MLNRVIVFPYVCCAALLLCLVGWTTSSISSPTREPVSQQSKNRSESTEDLIAKLQNESEEGIGFHSTAWASVFVAIAQEPEFNGGILGSRKPHGFSTMAELVKRG